MADVKLTYYVDTLSSWCLIAETALDRLRDEFGTQMELEWKIVALNEGAPFDGSPETFEWFYRRTKAVTGTQLNAAWHTSMEDGSFYSNLAAEAARTLGSTGDRVRRALSRGALVDGKRVPEREVALDVAAQAGGIDREMLSKTMDDPRTLAAIMRATMELRQLPVTVIPCFSIENHVGDRAILSGLYEYDTIAAVVREMVRASERYRTFMAADPGPA